MALLKLHGMMAAGVTVAALAAGGTAAAAAIVSGPVDSAGVVHGCYSPQGKGSYQLKLQNAGTNCPKGTTPITWNQKGPQGPAGATGATGATGPAGPGLVFTTGSGGNGPALAAAGTYFIDVTVSPFNNTAVSATVGCAVTIPDPLFPGAPMALFSDTYQMLAGSSSTYTLSGMATLTAGATPTVQCSFDNGQSVPLEGATWYAAHVQTAS